MRRWSALQTGSHRRSLKPRRIWRSATSSTDLAAAWSAAPASGQTADDVGPASEISLKCFKAPSSLLFLSQIRDKPKFGGPGVQKQKCQEKKCTNPVVSFQSTKHKFHPHLISRDPILDRIMILSLKWVQKYLFYDKIVYINANLFISYHLIHCVFLVHSWPLFLQVRGCDRCTWNLDFLSQTVWCQLISDLGNCLKC